MKKRFFQFCQAGLTLGVLFWLFHDPKKRDAMFDALAAAHWGWMLIGALVGLVGEAAGIMRWRMFLAVQGIQIGWWKATRWFFIGLFFNIFLPGTTGGDLARLYYLWNDFPEKRQGAVLTLVADRLIGLIPLIAAAAIGTALNFAWLTSTPATAGLLYCMLIFCAGISVVIALSFALSSGFFTIPRWFPGRERLQNLSEAWGLFLADGRRFTWTLLLSVPVLFSYYGGFYCASRAVDSGAKLREIFCIMPIVTVITSLPVSVAGLGVREGLFERLLGDLCGTPSQVAALVSLLGFSIFTTFGMGGALIYLFSPRMDREKLRRMEAGRQPWRQTSPGDPTASPAAPIAK